MPPQAMLVLGSLQVNELTVTGPFLSTSTCSRYVPGNMKMVWAEPSFGRDATAADMVVNWPVVALGLTTTEPAGGEVRDAAWTKHRKLVMKRTVKIGALECMVSGGPRTAMQLLVKSLGEVYVPITSARSRLRWWRMRMARVLRYQA